MSYVSLCLYPLVPAGPDYPEFSSEQHMGGTCLPELSEGRAGEVSGQVFRPQPLGSIGASACQHCNDILINDAVFCFGFGTVM